jgi:hypothetical protein
MLHATCYMILGKVETNEDVAIVKKSDERLVAPNRRMNKVIVKNIAVSAVLEEVKGVFL